MHGSWWSVHLLECLCEQEGGESSGTAQNQGLPSADTMSCCCSVHKAHQWNAPPLSLQRRGEHLYYGLRLITIPNQFVVSQAAQ